MATVVVALSKSWRAVFMTSVEIGGVSLTAAIAVVLPAPIVPTSRILYSLATSVAPQAEAERAAQGVHHQAIAARGRAGAPGRRRHGVGAGIRGEEIAQGAGIQDVDD